MGVGDDVLFLDPPLGAVGGHHAPLARGFAGLLDAPPTFAGALTGGAAGVERFVGVFRHRLEDAFRLTRYGGALAGPAGIARLGQVLDHFWGAPRRVLPAAPDRRPAFHITGLKRLLTPLQAEPALEAMMGVTPWSAVVCLAADPATLSALHSASRHFAREDGPALHLVFMYPEAEFLGARTERAYFDLLKEMLVWPRAPLLHAELAEHAAALEQILGAAVGVQPLPYRLPGNAPAPSGPFTVSALGAARADKGFDQLPGIVERTRMLAPDIQFRVQRPRRAWEFRRVVRALEGLPGVALLPPGLDDSAYEAEVVRSHVILLAYDPERYARRSSGVYADAVGFARPVVCVAKTALARNLKGNGVTADSAEGYASAILLARANYERLRAAALMLRDQAVDEMRKGSLVRALTANGAT